MSKQKHFCKHLAMFKKDDVRMPCFRVKDGIVTVGLEDEVEVWKEYEEKLLNDKNK